MQCACDGSGHAVEAHRLNWYIVVAYAITTIFSYGMSTVS